jgi:D-lactate dehydrogenase (cytochrome)
VQQKLRCYSTEIEPKTPKRGSDVKVARSFQGQMLGSIGARLRREREQRDQYEKWRDMTDPSRNWMITISESVMVAIGHKIHGALR